MSGNTSSRSLPPWLDYGLMPLINLLLALAVAGVVVAAIGQNPLAALTLLVQGAFGSGESLGYTLYYTTNMVFAGLAVAVAFHCGLFNIGGEGQAYIAGLGVALVALYLDFLPFWILAPLMLIGAMAFGAGWAAIPGWLQAKRGSHVVITTIMFNFISYSVMTYMLVNVLIQPGQMAPESPRFAENAQLPALHDLIPGLASSPLNITALWALFCLVGIWLFLWHSRFGYAMRVVGANPQAAIYAGINPGRQIILAMALSGALAGGLALNEVGGVHYRLLVGFTNGYGFTGIAVAMMGRNHPVGVLLAGLLFGALYQGGAELAFDMPEVSVQVVVVIQGLVILFTGALEHMFRPALGRMAARWEGRRRPLPATERG
jgi:simple sugar transport system permease protein